MAGKKAEQKVRFWPVTSIARITEWVVDTHLFVMDGRGLTACGLWGLGWRYTENETDVTCETCRGGNDGREEAGTG